MSKVSIPKEKFSYDLHFRIGKKELEFIQDEARKTGVTVSHAARKLMLKKGSSSLAEMTDLATNKKLLLGVESIRASFRKLVQQHQSSLNVYTKSLALTDLKGNPVLNAEKTNDNLRNLNDSIFGLQESVNSVMRLLDAQDIHMVARPEGYVSGSIAGLAGGTPDAAPSSPQKAEIPAVEQACVIGNVISSPERVTAKSGRPCWGFRVSCRTSQAKTTDYKIYYYTDVKKFNTDSITPGRSVCVVGALRTPLVTAAGEPSAELWVIADSIKVLGGELGLGSQSITVSGVISADAKTVNTKSGTRSHVFTLTCGETSRYDVFFTSGEDKPKYRAGVPAVVTGTLSVSVNASGSRTFVNRRVSSENIII